MAQTSLPLSGQGYSFSNCRQPYRDSTLTDPGHDFYEHARAALIEAESAESVVRRRHAEPSGTVRLTASIPTAQFYLADRLPVLATA